MNLKELSQHLNLSQTTVSRALNGYPEVSESTRHRVMEAAQAMNYSPNARAQGLATGRANAIGHVIPISNRHEMVNPVFADFIAGAGDAYARNGYEMVLNVVDDQREEELYRQIKARGNVDGIIVHGPKMADSRIELLTELGLPFLVHGRASDIDVPYNWVDTNNNGAFRRATDFLLDLGHRKIGFINGLENLDFAYRRRAGFQEALANRGITPDPAHMRSSDMTEIFGYRSALEMLDGPNPPTAFLASSMLSAYGVRRALDDIGLKMGRDVSVVTHDDDLGYLKNGENLPIFTATRSSVRQAGTRCAELLMQTITQPDSGPTSEMMEAELIIGDSTGPCLNRD